MKPIDKIFLRAQRLQKVCFGTPVSFDIDTCKGGLEPNGKFFVVNTSVSISHNVEIEKEQYIFDSYATNEALYQMWGCCSKDVNALLDKYVGHKKTSAVNVKNIVQQSNERG